MCQTLEPRCLLQPYLRGMLIRLAALLVLVAACASDTDANVSPEESTSEVSQGLSCGFYKYSCLPRDVWANWSCEEACGGSGHCIDYLPREEEWCWLHPGQAYSPLKLCSSSGDPAWRTWCAAGPVP